MEGVYKAKLTKTGYKLSGPKELKIEIRTKWVKGIREEKPVDSYFLQDGNFEYKLTKVQRRVLNDPNWDYEVYGWTFNKGLYEIERYYDENNSIQTMEIRRMK